jgi:2-polyprenyl-6-methoxyphenol hydroxylase-like FAD-dependent oxidoreductase
MKILIVGGGIGGLALAGFTKKYNIGETILVEQSPELRNMGYAIALWGNGWRILRELGIEDAVAKEGYELSWNIFEDAHGKILAAFPLSTLRELGPTIVIPRAVLQKELVKCAEGTDIRLGISVKSIKHSGGKTDVVFNDGKNETFNIVIGADGVRSSVRDMVFGKDFIKNYGWSSWAYWLPKSFKLRERQGISFLGNGKVCAIFPTPTRITVLFVAKTEYSPENRGSRLQKTFAEFGGATREILQNMPPSEQIFYDNLAFVNMPLWHKERVVLIGDAQHATSILTGMGASMALEDAFVLADELRKNAGDIDKALEVFSGRRKKRIKQFRTMERRIGRWGMTSGLARVLRDKIIPFVPASFFLNDMRKFLEGEI